MAKYYKISLKPEEPYFFGSERIFYFGNTPTQRARTNPYFIQSETLPTQTALFGVLRYLGIQNPKVDYSLSEKDRKNIGNASYQLHSVGQTFGCIQQISPLYLEDEDGTAWFCVPANRSTQKEESASDTDCTLYDNYQEVASLFVRRNTPIENELTEKELGTGKDTVAGKDTEIGKDTKTEKNSENERNTIEFLSVYRLFPKQYNEKIWDGREFVSFNNKRLQYPKEELFRSNEQVGIRRPKKNGLKTNDDSENAQGYYKKEYKILNRKYAFCFIAQTEDDFIISNATHVFMGQGKSPFSVKIEDITPGTGGASGNVPSAAVLSDTAASDTVTLDAVWKETTGLRKETLEQVFPKQIHVTKPDGTDGEEDVCYLYAASDIFYPGNIDDLKMKCRLMLAGTKEYRTYFTNYGKAMRERFEKKPELLRLLKAGSVFLFENAGQRKEFLEVLTEDQELYSHGQIAGFNQLIDVF